jgi:CSLREA domain-containing protein
MHTKETATRRRLVASGGMTAGALLAMAGTAQAAPITYTVGTNADASSGGACTTPTNSDCSLREAITLANTNAGADTIVFNSNLTGSTITLSTGEMLITDALSINGPGATQLTVDADDNSRIFSIDPGTADDPVSISGLTLANGFVGNASGGAIRNVDSELTISGSVVRDSYASGDKYAGGGVYTLNGSLDITNSTVSGNGAYYGGGVGVKYADVTITGSTLTGNAAYGDTSNEYLNAYGGAVWIGEGALTIDSSTLDHNVATDGGGVYASGRSGGPATVAVNNSTIAQNHVRDDGGAIWQFDASTVPLTVTGSTIVGNSADNYAGALDSGSPDPVLQDSIVTGNSTDPSKSDTSDVYASGAHFSTSFSLIGIPGSYVVQTVPGSVLVGVNPQLGSLAANGGPTQTMLPAATSPVIDQGKSFGLTSDQRALARPVEIPTIPNSTAAGADGADIGAVEVQSVPTTPPAPATKKHKKCKKHKKKHKRGADSSKKHKKHKKCKKHKKKKK